MSMEPRKVFVAMSGGVDSSVAALLLKEQGYDCTGVFMRCYNLDGCAERDAEDARRVANTLGIPFYTFDFEEEYKRKVVEYMIDGYKKGITPNPDVVCNREIKFGLFLEKALSLGADYVATGHYVRIRPHTPPGAGGSVTPAVTDHLHSRRAVTFGDPARHVSESRQSEHADSFGLWEAEDKSKDQSYFLWTLTQKELVRCLFPVGDFLKSEVRELARKADLPTAEKKDSQGICFLGDVDVFDFLKRHIKEKKGDIVLALSGVEGTTYRKVGEHRGVWFYTIGQRHGLDIRESGKMLRRHGGHETTPFYVAAKDTEKNVLVVAEGDRDPALFAQAVVLSDVSFVHGEPTTLRTGGQFPVRARVRYRQVLAGATLSRESGGVYHLGFDVPAKFVAPGQSAVFYRVSGNPEFVEGHDELELVGGGIITQSLT
jgi:tRNA-uridine 2-sulfurtransferase